MHLTPRILSLNVPSHDYSSALGYGKMAASITMTLFYALLWGIGVSRYPSLGFSRISILVYGLAIARITLCLLPQNNWGLNKESGLWHIWRNIPFFMIGGLTAALYAASWLRSPDGFSPIWMAVAASFAFYSPVVLWSGKSRKVGMLMIPKSLAYVFIVLAGFAI
jgi:hypothetical protein